MGGGGGGGGRVTPEAVASKIRAAERAANDSVFASNQADYLASLLSDANSRDVELTRDRLDEIQAALATEMDEELPTLFGGSVAKYTYVDGISDVDALLILNDSSLGGDSPPEVLDYLKGVLGEELHDVKVSAGTMAVTVQYKDGSELQLLPALKVGSRLRVPSRDGAWAGIDPRAFTDALSRRNDECAGKLVPTIKLFKTLNANLPKSQQISGYHMESIAVEVFRGYTGVKDVRTMLPIFVEGAAQVVLSPIADRTGQSVHVDDSLGPKNSAPRKLISRTFERLSKKMRNATAGQSMDEWRRLFGD